LQNINYTMKSNILLLIFLLCFGCIANSQNATQPGNNPDYIKCASFSVTKPLRDMPSAPSVDSEERELLHQVGDKNSAILHLDKEPPPDQSIQYDMGIQSLDTPLVNFDGGSYSRPDATGAAGPDYYVQAVNFCTVGIYHKNGTLALSTSITNLGGGCAGDPIVLYDKFADRWLIMDFVSGYQGIVVAISQTPDPTGSYYLYNYSFPWMADFAKFNVWTDGYYVSFRTFSGSGNDTLLIGVLDRGRMLNGDASAGLIITRLPGISIINSNTQFPSCPKILSSDGALPPFGKPNYLMYYTNVNCGDTANSIVIYKLSTDTVLKTCTVTFDTALITAPFNSYFYGFGATAAIAEPGGTKAWPLDGAFQYRVPYIRFTGYNSVALSHTVNLGNYVAGIRWYELRQNDTTLKWSIYQQATYGPNDSINRWNGSICMNLNGDISLAYNVTSQYHNLYPGIRYTGRLFSDSINKMTFGEQTAIAGNSSYGTQWGDFCESTLDPDGLTFWHTNQYIKSGNPATRIFSFRLNSTLTAVSTLSNNSIDFKVFQSADDLNVQANGLSSNDPVVITLFDLNGREISSRWVTPVANQLENKINLKGLSAEAYLVRIGNTRFQQVIKVFIKP
jgi:hypothetical protein